jgi:uncharacterized protein YndB with AHSA1/START domain
MINVEQSVVIDRPVEDVFSFVADQTNAPRWQHGLLEVQRITELPIGLGTRHTAVRTFLGRRMALTNEYVEFEPNTRVTFTGESGSVRFETSYLAEPLPDGTKLTCRMEMEPRGLFRVATPLIARALERDFVENFGTLKALLEQATSTPPD